MSKKSEMKAAKKLAFEQQSLSPLQQFGHVYVRQASGPIGTVHVSATVLIGLDLTHPVTQRLGTMDFGGTLLDTSHVDSIADSLESFYTRAADTLLEYMRSLGRDTSKLIVELCMAWTDGNDIQLLLNVGSADPTTC